VFIFQLQAAYKVREI